MGRCLNKPVKQSDLLDAILEAAGVGVPAAAGPEVVEGRGPQARTGLHILVAEDGRIGQLVARRMLENQGHEVTVVGNGQLAIEALAGGHYDAVLMDVHMPVMNGLEATQAIRARERDEGGHLPIIAMTANAMRGDREECLAAGMDDYVVKPMRAPDLEAALGRSVDGGGWAGAPESRAAGAAPGDARRAERGALPAGDVFDSERFRRNIGERELMLELIGFFDEDSGRMMAGIQEAAAGGDAGALHRAAHGLKGMLGNYCAGRATVRARRLDELARAGDLEGARGLIPELRTEVDRLRESLEGFRHSLERHS